MTVTFLALAVLLQTSKGSEAHQVANLHVGRWVFGISARQAHRAEGASSRPVGTDREYHAQGQGRRSGLPGLEDRQPDSDHEAAARSVFQGTAPELGQDGEGGLREDNRARWAIPAASTSTN